MNWKRSKSTYPLLIIAAFAVGLLLAGGLLYRTINRASVADREQQSEFLRAAMRSFRGEFVATLLEVRATFHPVPRAGKAAALDEYLAGFYSQWKSNDANGALVSSFSVATRDADGKLQFRTLDPKTGHFKQEPWPKSLQIFRPRVEVITNREGERDIVFRVFRANGFPLAVDGDRPVVVVPVLESGGRGRGLGSWPGLHGPPEPPLPSAAIVQRFGEGPPGRLPGGMQPPVRQFRAPLGGRLRGWCFLELNLNYFKQQLLPQFVERSFGATGLSSYRVGILTGNPPQIVYGSEPGLKPSQLSSPDAEAVLFTSSGAPGPLFRGRMWGFSARVPPAGEMGPSILGTVRARPRVGITLGPFTGNRFQEANAWVLMAKNKAGSIDAVVARTRRRNLALGFGVLLLLAFSMGSLLITTHRARELARREVEFVAGVSHEFRTPLASIQSAGFNLASGVVRKGSRVQEYGTLVQNEARRLTDMIEQVMSYAGIQSGGKRYELVPTQISGLIDEALAEYGPALRDGGWQIEKKVEENLPVVLAEAPSIESAVKNLLANAIKYAGTGKWLGVTANEYWPRRFREPDWDSAL
ncbi:MAG: HAMP domain-containing sensor histidine kinase [Acidobacteriota bacterium]